MSTEPLISIIVPVYNLESYIENTLHSIINQTYTNIEIVVVDDGSTDRTSEIILKLQKNNPQIVFISQKNSGVVSARRTGINNSKGEFIGFVDGDDLVDEDMYEFLMKNIIKENADISHCGYVMHIGDRSDYYYNTKNYLIQNKENGIYDLLSGEFVEPGLCNKIFKRKIIIEAINDERVNGVAYLEDLLINYLAFKKSEKSVYEDKCKYHYMVRKNSAATSSISEKKIVDQIKVISMINDDCCDGNIKNIAYKRYIAMLVKFSTVRISNDIYKRIIKMLRNEAETVKITNSLGKKLKMLFILSTYFPTIYLLVRKIYEKITHINKKYEV